METQTTAPSTVWALGDYHRFAKEMVWSVGPELVAACGIGPGQRVLDVAAGTGNVAIRAAEAGADVVASDLTPESLAAGEREARTLGLELDWVVADAQALPFADAEFDVVTSSFGAMFAPDHRAVADELLRVCRRGGTIGLASFTPEGGVGEFFGVFAPYLPAPPPGALAPVLWGDEAHVRELLGSGASLSIETAVARRAQRRRAASVLRLLSRDLRPGRRGVRRRPGGRPRLPRVRHRAEQGQARRSVRVSLRVPARRRAEELVR